MDEREAREDAKTKPPPTVKLNFATAESVDNNASSEEADDDSPSAKFRRGGDLPSDLDLGSNSGGSEDEKCEDDGEWNMMGAALEREFLGLD